MLNIKMLANKFYIHNTVRKILLGLVTGLLIYLLLVFGVNFYMKYYSFFNIPGFIFYNIGVVSSITFGISSSILALVGLVAVFIAINSQQSIYKAREIIWQLTDLCTQVADEELYDSNYKKHDLVFSKLASLYRLYRRITNPEFDFTCRVVFLVRCAIGIVISTWCVLTVILYNSSVAAPIDSNNLNKTDYYFLAVSIIAGVIILVGFERIIGKLNKILEIGKLPSIKLLLNLGAKELDIPIVHLVAWSTKVSMFGGYRINNNFQYLLAMGLPESFYNFNVSLELKYKGEKCKSDLLYISENAIEEQMLYSSDIVFRESGIKYHYLCYINSEEEITNYEEIDLEISFYTPNDVISTRFRWKAPTFLPISISAHSHYFRSVPEETVGISRYIDGKLRIYIMDNECTI